MKNTVIWGKKKKEDLDFTFQHTFIWEGKKKRKKKTFQHTFIWEGKKKKKPTGTRLLGREKKKIEKFANWQG